MRLLDYSAKILIDYSITKIINGSNPNKKYSTNPAPVGETDTDRWAGTRKYGGQTARKISKQEEYFTYTNLSFSLGSLDNSKPAYTSTSIR